jgi:hypothetical protein
MDGRYVEPRQVMWAVPEIIWEDDRGMSFRVPAILEDTSKSGACIRVKRPLAIGSRLIIKWHREQFSAVARNCRRDGGDFLLGVCRAPEVGRAGKPEPAPVRIETKSHGKISGHPAIKSRRVLRVYCPRCAYPARPTQYPHDQQWPSALGRQQL